MADPSRARRIIGVVLLGFSIASVVALADNLRFSPVSRKVVEARLGEYRGSNAEREATLKRMFVEAGCGEHLSEQPVKGSKAPNLICVQPGTSGKAIII